MEDIGVLEDIPLVAISKGLIETPGAKNFINMAKTVSPCPSTQPVMHYLAAPA